MRYLLAENLAVLICAAAGFILGAVYLRPKKPLYAAMIVLGVGCVMLGRLYQCVCLLTGASLTERFQIGMLGAAGAFSFFFAANYGQIDSLVDDGGAGFRRYRALAWAGPLAMVLLYLPAAAAPADPGLRIGCGFVTFLIGCACYFHVKHLIIPDVDYGVVRCQRGYNALALGLGAASILEMTALCRGLEPLLLIAGAGICLLCLAIVPVMDRGVKRWTT